MLLVFGEVLIDKMSVFRALVDISLPPPISPEVLCLQRIYTPACYLTWSKTHVVQSGNGNENLLNILLSRSSQLLLFPSSKDENIFVSWA